MRNQLTDAAIDSFIARSGRLTEGTAPLWGGMSATGMLYHCTLINGQILAPKPQPRGLTFKERLLRPVFYLLPKLPKGVQTGKAFIPPPDDGLQFTTGLADYAQTLRRFKTSGDIQGLHPVFGPLNTLEWRRFVYLHTDHHLRQFGV